MLMRNNIITSSNLHIDKKKAQGETAGEGPAEIYSQGPSPESKLRVPTLPSVQTKLSVVWRDKKSWNWTSWAECSVKPEQRNRKKYYQLAKWLLVNGNEMLFNLWGNFSSTWPNTEAFAGNSQETLRGRSPSRQACPQHCISCWAHSPGYQAFLWATTTECLGNKLLFPLIPFLCETISNKWLFNSIIQKGIWQIAREGPWLHCGYSLLLHRWALGHAGSAHI